MTCYLSTFNLNFNSIKGTIKTIDELVLTLNDDDFNSIKGTIKTCPSAIRLRLPQ